MEAPAKRNAFLDWLFGAPLTDDDLARRSTARPPRWVRNTQLSLYLLTLGLFAAVYMGLTDGLPLVGPWLAQGRPFIPIGCFAIILAVNWSNRRRAGMERKH